LADVAIPNLSTAKSLLSHVKEDIKNDKRVRDAGIHNKLEEISSDLQTVINMLKNLGYLEKKK
jgi:hypothetical protein